MLISCLKLRMLWHFVLLRVVERQWQNFLLIGYSFYKSPLRLFVRKINISNYNLFCGESGKKIFLALLARGKKEEEKRAKEQKSKGLRSPRSHTHNPKTDEVVAHARRKVATIRSAGIGGIVAP